LHLRIPERRSHVPKTLLAVDDSATMRKVLEITFAGEDFRVVSADGAQSALARLGEDPAVAVIDMSLGSDDGYALAKEVRARNGRVAVLLMSSRYTPYDAARGRDAGVDDFIDKPFDTQSLLDKVKKAVAARESAPRAAAPPPVPTTTMPLHTTSTFGAPRPAAPGAPPVAAGVPRAPVPTQRTHTLSFEGSPLAPPPVASAAPVTAPGPLGSSAPVTAPMPTSPSAPSRVAPPQSAAAPRPHTAAPVVPAAPAAFAPSPTIPAEAARPPLPTVSDGIATVNGAMAVKLGDLGLTPEQVTAVLALSREVVERVVWEVVPQLAETIIREEITRLTKEA
jgi:CheY-like chemotaxis protein